MDQFFTGLRNFQTALARLSGALLMVGLILAMVNFLEGGKLFNYVPALDWVWSGSQAIAVESNLWWVFFLLVAAWGMKSWGRVVLYSIAGGLLVFTAIVITDVEAVRQALNLTLPQAFGAIHIPILALTTVRSIVAVGLVVIAGVVEATQDRPSQSKASKPMPSTGASGSNGRGTPQQAVQSFQLLNPKAGVKEIAKGARVSEPTVRKYMVK